MNRTRAVVQLIREALEGRGIDPLTGEALARIESDDPVLGMDLREALGVVDNEIKRRREAQEEKDGEPRPETDRR